MEKLIKEGFKLIGVANVPNRNSFMDTLSKHGLRRWRAAYGHRPAVLDEAWRQIKSEARKRKIQLKHFFWALHFMKTYQSEDNLANRMNTTPKTFREKAKTIIKLLKREMPGVVSQLFSIFTSIVPPIGSDVHSILIRFYGEIEMLNVVDMRYLKHLWTVWISLWRNLGERASHGRRKHQLYTKDGRMEKYPW